MGPTSNSSVEGPKVSSNGRIIIVESEVSLGPPAAPLASPFSDPFERSLTSMKMNEMMRQKIRKAMEDSDELVIEMDYCDSKGVTTRRIVSPIRFLASDRFLGLCLCREEPRQFYLARCSRLRLMPATDVLMPVPMA